jgi:hypothetical protein
MRAAAVTFAVLALVLVLGACELTSNLAPLKDGQCPSGKKGCPINGTWSCVDETSTDTSCSESTCLSCTERLDHTKTTACDPNGLCVVGSCDDGWAPCSGDRLLGCDTNIWTDSKNCGVCGYGCPAVNNGIPLCFPPGVCKPLCMNGYSDCDGKYYNGCECGPPKRCVSGVCM